MNETDRTPRTAAFVALCERQLEQLTELLRNANMARTPEAFAAGGGLEVESRYLYQQNLVSELRRTRGETA